MITIWDYADTELPCTDNTRSKHMKDMGQKGWELVSVSANPATGSHVYFWKRPIIERKNLAALNTNLGIANTTQEYTQSARSEVKLDRLSENHKDNFAGKRSVSNYRKFPDPQILMVVKYRPKEGCFNEFRDELYKRDYPNCIARHMGFNKQKEFVCVSLIESIDAALDLEGVGTNWLDSVEHLLIKYPNGSRTESFSGPVLAWHPNLENLIAFDKDPKVFSVFIVELKQGAFEKNKEIILNPPTTPRNLFKCVAQYKDTDDTYIQVSLDTSIGQTCAEDYSDNSNDHLTGPMIAQAGKREFFCDQEDFVWFNKKYI